MTPAAVTPGAATGAFSRLDLWLWCARFGRQRSVCARMAGEGAVRINRQPTDKPHARLRVGDVLTLRLPRATVVVRVLALAGRRGSAEDAARLYELVPEPCPGVSCMGAQSSAYAGASDGAAEAIRSEP